MKRKNYVSGFGEKDPDIHEFLRPDNTDPWKAGASGHGRNARYAQGDNAGDNGMHGDFSTDDWRDDSRWFGHGVSDTGDTDRVHDELYALIDRQADQPSGPILGGGGPVSDNKHGGVGAGKPRFAPKNLGHAGQKNWDSVGGRDRSGGRR
jgi:hypothetical protein